MTDDYIEAIEVARLAHRAAIEEISEIQQRVALRQGVQAFGKDALPILEFWRRTIGGLRVLTEAARFALQEAQADRDRLEKLMPIARSLEDLFAQQKERDGEAFGAAMAQYIRTRMAPKR